MDVEHLSNTDVQIGVGCKNESRRDALVIGRRASVSGWVRELHIAGGLAMDIGGTLRDAREQRGVSIESLAHRTNIKVSILRAIELNAFDQAPAGIFMRGFLRAYAREVGLDPEEIVSRYVAELAEIATSPALALGTHLRQRTAAAGSVSDDVRSPIRLRALAHPHWQITVILLVVGIYLLILAAPWRTSRRPTASAVGVANAISQPPPAAVTRGPVATSGKSIRLDVQTRSACWVSATADGQRVIYKTMQPGERQTIVVRDEVVLRVGDAAAFAFSIDGAPGRSLGGVGQAVTVRIAPANYDALLAKR